MICHVNSAVLVFMAYSKHIQAQMSVHSCLPGLHVQYMHPYGSGVHS